jgi:hypothetical protein
MFSSKRKTSSTQFLAPRTVFDLAHLPLRYSIAAAAFLSASFSLLASPLLFSLWTSELPSNG